MQVERTNQILGFWQVRQEDAGTIADRLTRLFTMLRPIDPLLSKWYFFGGNEAFFDLDLYGDHMADLVAGCVIRGDFNEPQPRQGYNFSVLTSSAMEGRPDTLWLSGFMGCQGMNSICISTCFDCVPDPRIVRYPVVAGVLRALYETFEPERISAGPTDLRDLIPRRQLTRPLLPLCWMIKLSPPLAKLVVPPGGVTTERDVDGSLFMAATEQPFVTANPADLAVARAIYAVVDPLNTSTSFQTYVPWTGQ